jgi:predicted AlkP superfamily phosphohydrolase/phosphomutase
MSKKKRVVVIGLDGMAWHILTRLFDYGAMPNLEEIAETSLKGVLKSTVPPYTPTAWTSIATGVNPGKHGVYGFVTLTKDHKKVRIMTSLDSYYPRLHEMVALKGLKSVCINQPLTYPIIEMHNIIVLSDWTAPKLSYYPNTLEAFLKKYVPYAPAKPFQNKQVFLETIFDEAQKRVDTVNEMMEKLPWNLFWAIYNEPDFIMHKAYEDILKEDYSALKTFKKLDETIGKAATLADLLLVVSDHGFSKFTHLINVNTLLDRLGLISKTSTQQIKEFWHHRMYQQEADFFQIPLWMHRILAFGPVRTAVKKAYRRFTKRDVKARLPYVDPEKSKAFIYSVSSYGIYVKERALVDPIISYLRNANGFKSVWRREEIYHGQVVDKAPHIVFLLNHEAGYSLGTTAVSSELISKRMSYDHTMDGVMIIHGNKIRPGWIEKAETVDIVPTVLSYLGLPLPHDTDGKIISGAIPFPPRQEKHYNYLKHWQLIRQVQLRKSKLAVRA